MENKEKINLDKRIVIGSIITVVLLVFGITYAYFIAQGQSAIQTVTTANLGLTFDDGTAIVRATDIIPIYTDEVATKATNKTFTLTKTEGSKDIYTKIELSNISLTNALAQYDLKWALYKGTTAEVSAGTAIKVATGDFGGKTTGDIIIATNQLISSTPVTYNLYIWINETDIDQGTMMGQTLTATINATGSSVQENTLANAILTNGTKYIISNESYEYSGCMESCLQQMTAEACYNAGACADRVVIPAQYSEIDKTIYTTPTFSSESTDKGLFVQQGDVTKSEMGFPTYYFRGNILGNYVKFGSKNDGDDIIWRILKINEDGSIKLISENSSITSTWNSNKNSKYVNDDGTDSEIKAATEAWYNSNIGNNSNLDSKVVQSTFCNDISGINFELTDTNGDSKLNDETGYYGNAHERIQASTPTFICPAGAITVYSKVGLITADEMLYSGSLYNKSSSNISFYKPTASWDWSLTPSGYTYPYHLFNFSLTDNYEMIGTHGNPVAVPVINLSPDVVISGGDGLSADTAYIIQ